MNAIVVANPQPGRDCRASRGPRTGRASRDGCTDRDLDRRPARAGAAGIVPVVTTLIRGQSPAA